MAPRRITRPKRNAAAAAAWPGLAGYNTPHLYINAVKHIQTVLCVYSSLSIQLAGLTLAG